MEITFAKSQIDLKEIADLMGKIFARRSYFDFYSYRMRYQTLDPWYKPEHSRIIKENGKIVSHISIIKKPIQFGPAIIKLAGIGDVFTHPDARGKGYTRKLMEDALQYMKANGYPLTMLYGIPNYYHRFGYIEAVKEYKLEIPVKKIDTLNSHYKTREWRTSDIPKMLELYKNNCHDCLLTVERNEQYLKRHLTDSKRIVLIVDENDTPIGYAHLIDETTKQFMVNEAITSSFEVSKSLLIEIAKRFSPMISTNLEIRMSPQMPFVRHLYSIGCEFKIRSFSESEGNGMLAIVDLHKLLNDLTPLLNNRLNQSEFYKLSTDLILRTDKENVRLKIQKGQIQEIEKINLSQEFALKMNYRYFVRNIVGYWSIDDLLQMTVAKISDEKSQRLLHVLFPHEEPYMLPLDYF